MALKKKINFSNVEKQLIDKREKQLRTLGSEIIVGIIKRTQSGKDKDLKTFKPYSKAYAKSKAKYSSKVNLTVSGNMLNSIDYKSIKNGLRFYFNANEEKKKAKGNIGYGRKFFGIDKKQKAWIKNKLEDI